MTTADSSPSGRRGPEPESTSERGHERDFWRGLGRAFGGALVFALPIFMTMEMWWLGFDVQTYRLAVLLALNVPTLLLLSRYLGFKESVTWMDDLADALVAYGVGIAASLGLLLALEVIRSGMGAHEIVGKVAVQSVSTSLGAMLARRQLAGGGGGERQDKRRPGYPGELFIMGVGAAFLAFSVAPTQEIIVISYRMDPGLAIGLVLISLVVVHGFVYAVNFRRRLHVQRRSPQWSLFLRFSLPGYAISLLVSAYMLWTFKRFDGTGMLVFVTETVVLGIPASVGAAAARLMLGPSGSPAEDERPGKTEADRPRRRSGARRSAGSRGDRSPGSEDTPRVEWWAAAVGGCLILLQLGFAVWEAATRPAVPLPQITFRAGHIERVPTGYLAPLVVRNDGSLSVATLVVQGRLEPRGDTSTVEQAQATLAYVPAHSSRRAGLLFTRNPRSYHLRLQPRGYRDPENP